MDNQTVIWTVTSGLSCGLSCGLLQVDYHVDCYKWTVMSSS